MYICIIDHKGHALLRNHNIFPGLVVVCLQWFAAGPVLESACVGMLQAYFLLVRGSGC